MIICIRNNEKCQLFSFDLQLTVILTGERGKSLGEQKMLWIRKITTLFKLVHAGSLKNVFTVYSARTQQVSHQHNQACR